MLEPAREIAVARESQARIVDAEAVGDAIWAVVNGRLDPSSAPIIIGGARS